jgi:hypothetical protein
VRGRRPGAVWCGSSDVLVLAAVAVGTERPEHEAAEQHADDDAAERDSPLGPRVVGGELLDDLMAVDVERGGAMNLEDTARQRQVEDEADDGADESAEQDAQQDADGTLDELRVQERQSALDPRQAPGELLLGDVLLVGVSHGGVLVVCVVEGGVALVVVVLVAAGRVVLVVLVRVVVLGGGEQVAVLVRVCGADMRVHVAAVALTRSVAVVAHAEPGHPGGQGGKEGHDHDHRRCGFSGHSSDPFISITGALLVMYLCYGHNTGNRQG